MTTQKIAEAVARVEGVLQRRPQAGVHDDVPALAQWTSGTRCQTTHPSGVTVTTDMPEELGGTGDQVSPGWLHRAGLASCAATSILYAAAAQGITLTALEVEATSRSDTRGMLGMKDGDGEPVHAGPIEAALLIRIAADGVDATRLEAVARAGMQRSPVPNIVLHLTPLDVRIDVDRHGAVSGADVDTNTGSVTRALVL